MPARGRATLRLAENVIEDNSVASDTGMLKNVDAIRETGIAGVWAGALRKAAHPALVPAALFVALAMGLIVHWHAIGKYTPTGDEPHYMVIANSITRYHTLDTTRAYPDMIKAGLLPPLGSHPGPTTGQAIQGPHGLFSVHNIGLPLLIAIPLRTLGIQGARLIMVLLCSGVALLAYGFTGQCLNDRKLRILLATSLSCTAPFLPAAGQIYPDVPAGILFGYVLFYISRRVLGQHEPRTEHLMTGMAAGAIAFAPWLQIKFTAASLVSVIGCVCWAAGPRRITDRVAIFGAPLVASLALLIIYNRYAFGSAAGPYGDGALVLSAYSLMVLAGLHLDQFQGIFLLSPILLLAPLGTGVLVRQKPAFATFFLLLYASLVLPNAMHPNWYGGGSFAGRFIWTGAVLLFMPAVFGLRALRMSGKTIATICVLSLAIQSFYYLRYISNSFSLFNQPPPYFVESYTSLFSPYQKFLPEFVNISWAYRYPPNYGWLAGVVVLITAGWLHGRHGPDRHRASRPAGLAMWGLAAALPLAGAAAALAWQPPAPGPLVFHGADLPGLTGHVEGSDRVAMPGKDLPAFLSFGPYVSLPRGRFRFELVYSSDGSTGLHVGDWDIVANRGIKTLVKPTAMQGTEGRPTTIVGVLDIASANSGIGIEIRTRFAGVAPLKIDSITIQKL